MTGIILETWHFWFAQYLNILKEESNSNEERKTLLNSVNPKAEISGWIPIKHQYINSTNFG